MRSMKRSSAFWFAPFPRPNNNDATWSVIPGAAAFSVASGCQPMRSNLDPEDRIQLSESRVSV